MTFEEIKKRRDQWAKINEGTTQPLVVAELRDDVDELLAEIERLRNAPPKPGEFGYVLPALRRGEKVRRKKWREGWWLVVADGRVVLSNRADCQCPWRIVDKDILVDDWGVMDDEPEPVGKGVPGP